MNQVKTDSTASKTARKILVADDVFAARRIILRFLNLLGYDNVICTENGASTLAACKENEFDLIIIDYNLGDMNAVDVARELQALGDTPAMLIATSDASSEQLVAAHSVGIVDYMLKPLSKDVLEEKITHILEQK